MNICPCCQESYNADYESCPFCGTPPSESDNFEEDLMVAFQAGDESEAYLIKGLLESSGIPVMIRSRQVPMYDSVFTYGETCWGDVMVPGDNLRAAQRLIRNYLQSTEEVGVEE